MKIDAEKLAGNCTDISFKELADAVFGPNGEILQCPSKIRKALILRLEGHYGTQSFGNPLTGELNEMEAYLASAVILSKERKRQPTTRRPSTG